MTAKTSVYFPSIDGLRFIAFSFVFFRHFKLYIPSTFLYEIGWTGVELFFLISGFLLTKLLSLESIKFGNVNLKKYFFRRSLRIWPLYFLTLILTVCFSFFYFDYSFSFYRLAGNMFFIDNWLSGIDKYNPNFASFHLWSISMEEQYYLILPFLIPWLVKQNKKTVSIFFTFVFLILLISRYIAIQSNVQHPFIYVLPVSGDCFFAGILMGLNSFEHLWKKINSLLAFLVGVGFLMLLNTIPERKIIDMNQLYIYPITALAFSFLLVAVLNARNQVLVFIFSNRLIRYLGKISYGLYVFHIGVIWFITNTFQTNKLDTDIKWSFPMAFMLTILLAIISYELFEKRFLKMKSRFTRIKNRPV